VIRRRLGVIGVAVVTATLTSGAPAHAQGDDRVPLDENTALMVGANTLKLGLLAFEYGLSRKVSIGVDPPAWLAGTFSSVFAPNLHVKVALIERRGYVLSARVAGYYVNLTNSDGARGSLVEVVPTVFASSEVLRHLWLHGEVAYNWVRAVGAGDLTKGEVDNAIAVRAWQAGAVVQYKLSPLVSLIGRGRYQFASTPLVVKGNGTLDPYTTAQLGAEVHVVHPHPYLAVAAIALTWRHVGLVAGGGYGQYFIPGANLPLAPVGFVPEGSLWVSF